MLPRFQLIRLSMKITSSLAPTSTRNTNPSHIIPTKCLFSHYRAQLTFRHHLLSLHNRRFRRRRSRSRWSPTTSRVTCLSCRSPITDVSTLREPPFSLRERVFSPTLYFTLHISFRESLLSDHKPEQTCVYCFLQVFIQTSSNYWCVSILFSAPTIFAFPCLACVHSNRMFHANNNNATVETNSVNTNSHHCCLLFA